MMDLFVLAADKDMLKTMKELLRRHDDLGIRKVRSRGDRHRFRDPGCRVDPSGPLRPYINGYAHALVIFDKEGCGRDSASREDLQKEVEQNLERNGWRGRCKAIVIEP